MHLLLESQEKFMAITILYQDAHIVVCVKEAGVSSQSPGMPERIAEAIGGDVPLAVHRLDRDVPSLRFSKTRLYVCLHQCLKGGQLYARLKASHPLIPWAARRKKYF